jgi:hypothetical protein
MNAPQKAYIAASKFFCLAATAAKHGGFWVSAAGGTANVVAGEISRATGVSYEEAHRILDAIGKEQVSEDWYQHLADINPAWDINEEESFLRWAVRTIARAACRGL